MVSILNLLNFKDSSAEGHVNMHEASEGRVSGRRSKAAEANVSLRHPVLQCLVMSEG